jgi:TonB family protein
VPFTGFYGGLVIYGLAATVNVAFAPPGARVFPLIVNDKYTSGSKHTSYNLRSAAWDDQPAGSIAVPSGYYYKVQVGSPFCVFRHKGGLGIDWIIVGDCPAGVKPPAAVLAQFAALPHNAQAPSTSAQSPPSYPGPAYPERAQRAGKEGRAVVHCGVANGGLVDCRVQSEDPPGYGFGNAAVGRIMSTDGGGGNGINPEQLKGRTEVDIPVYFKLTK